MKIVWRWDFFESVRLNQFNIISEISILIIGDGKCQMLPQFFQKYLCVYWGKYTPSLPKIIYITRITNNPKKDLFCADMNYAKNIKNKIKYIFIIYFGWTFSHSDFHLHFLFSYSITTFFPIPFFLIHCRRSLFFLRYLLLL